MAALFFIFLTTTIMTKQILIALIAVFLGQLPQLYAQRDHIWMFGRNHDAADSSFLFDFNVSPRAISLVQWGMPVQAGWAGICDTTGALLMYSNGLVLHDASFQLMQNGDSLNPGPWVDMYASEGMPYNDAILILPQPQNPSIYYVFYQHIAVEFNHIGTISETRNELHYSIVDMQVNNGMGAVVTKNVVLQDSINMGQLEAIKHANGDDWWIVQGVQGKGAYHRFLLTAQGIETQARQYIGQAPIEWYTGKGQACFSPDGSKYARYDCNNELQLFDFDRCTGLFSNPQFIQLNETSSPNGVAFSPNSRFLYVSAIRAVYQYDVQSTSLADSKDTVISVDTFVDSIAHSKTYFGYMALAPDDRIYINAPGTTFMHIIDSPNISGNACLVQRRALHFGNHLMFTCVPNYPHFRTPALPETACLSSTAVEEPLFTQNELFKLYPNPASQYITLEYTEPLSEQGIVVEILDGMGRVVSPRQIILQSPATLNTQHLSAGVYICRVETGKTVFNQRFIVLK